MLYCTKRNPDGDNLLSQICKGGSFLISRMKLMTYLDSKDPELVNAVNKGGRNALLNLCYHFNPESHIGPEQNCVDKLIYVKFLCEKLNANISQVDDNGCTAVMLVWHSTTPCADCATCRDEILSYILLKQPNMINAVNNDGETLIMTIWLHAINIQDLVMLHEKFAASLDIAQ